VLRSTIKHTAHGCETKAERIQVFVARDLDSAVYALAREQRNEPHTSALAGSEVEGCRP